MDLKNDHNVYILGAGFSQYAGLPLISDFLLRMRDSHEWLLQNGRKKEADAVAAVLQFRLEAASAAYWVSLDLENIEELFSLASATKGDMDRHIRIAIAATIDFARQSHQISSRPLQFQNKSALFGQANATVPTTKLPTWVQFSQQAGRLTIQPYTYFVARLLGMLRDGQPKGENTFITFNYDTLLEEALTTLQLGYAYGLGNGTVMSAPEPTGEPGAPTAPLLKLHGSVNWSRQIGPGGPVTIHKPGEQIPIGPAVPELIPPTWKKLFQAQLEAVWEAAVQHLNTATRIIIIGFSLPPTDMHFKYLIAAGLQRNLSLRQILFVNPKAKAEIEPRARKLLREAYIDSAQIDFEVATLDTFTRAAPGGQSKFHTINRPGEHGIDVTI